MADMNTVGVLVVDDEQFFREVLKDMLQREGFRVVAEAASGDEAVALFKQFSPDIVLMDIYMPGKNGIMATAEIMAFAPDARILICSGSGYDDDINAAIQSGARGIINKPFFDEEVMDTIRKTLVG